MLQGVNSSPPRTETILNSGSTISSAIWKESVGFNRDFSWQVPSDISLWNKFILYYRSFHFQPNKPQKPESFDHQTASYPCLSHLWKERLSWTLQLKPRSKTTFPPSKSPGRTIPFQVGKWGGGSGVTTVGGFTPIVQDYAPQDGKSVPQIFGYKKLPTKQMWSHHRLAPFDFLSKKPPFEFFAQKHPKYSAANDHISPFKMYFWIDDFTFFPRWAIHLLPGDVLLPSLCFGDTLHQWLWRTKSLLKLRHLFPSFLGSELWTVESLVSEEKTGSNKTIYQFTSQGAHEIRCKNQNCPMNFTFIIHIPLQKVSSSGSSHEIKGDVLLNPKFS